VPKINLANFLIKKENRAVTHYRSVPANSTWKVIGDICISLLQPGIMLLIILPMAAICLYPHLAKKKNLVDMRFI
jgi:hypothetical protein